MTGIGTKHVSCRLVRKCKSQWSRSKIGLCIVALSTVSVVDVATRWATSWIPIYKHGSLPLLAATSVTGLAGTAASAFISKTWRQRWQPLAHIHTGVCVHTEITIQISTEHPFEKCSAVIAQAGIDIPSSTGILTSVTTEADCPASRKQGPSPICAVLKCLRQRCVFSIKEFHLCLGKLLLHSSGEQPPRSRKSKAGFHSGCRELTEQLFILSNIIHRSWEFVDHMSSVDLEKVHNCVSRLLWENAQTVFKLFGLSQEYLLTPTRLLLLTSFVYGTLHCLCITNTNNTSALCICPACAPLQPKLTSWKNEAASSHQWSRLK